MLPSVITGTRLVFPLMPLPLKFTMLKEDMLNQELNIKEILNGILRKSFSEGNLWRLIFSLCLFGCAAVAAIGSSALAACVSFCVLWPGGAFSVDGA
jgi:hypothetical protein